MSHPKERSAGETLKALLRMKAEDEAREERELDRIEAMSPEEVKRELVEAGVDVKEAEAEILALFERYRSPARRKNGGGKAGAGREDGESPGAARKKG